MPGKRVRFALAGMLAVVGMLALQLEGRVEGRQGLTPGTASEPPGVADARVQKAFGRLPLVHPGADPDRIKLAYRGATAVTLTGGGELDVSTPVGSFRDAKPDAYQEVKGRRREVAAAYALAGEAGGGVQGYGFRLGPYDRGKLLVLDPAILVYAGYVGGSGFDAGFGIAVDRFGNAYITGGTTFPDLPVVPGSDLTFRGGGGHVPDPAQQRLRLRRAGAATRQRAGPSELTASGT